MTAPARDRRFRSDLRASGEREARRREKSGPLYAETASFTDCETFGGAGSKRSWRQL
jgi:hypothetical protein